MPLPTPAKSWLFNANNTLAAQGSGSLSNRTVLLAIVNALLALASNPWTVTRSSNSVSAGAANYWAAVANLVGNTPGSAHSWIVLRQAATGFELCIDLNNTNANSAGLFFSASAGFTGGTTTARATATDEMTIQASTWTSNTADVATRWSVMQSTDGQCTRIVTANAGVVTSFWLIDRVNNPTTGWATPFVAAHVAGPPTSTFFSTGSSLAKLRHAAVTCSVVFVADGMTNSILFADASYGNVANEISSEWALYPVGVAGLTTGARGRHGTFFDLWAGSAAVASGDTYPGDGSNQFIQAGVLVMPWNGGAFNLS